MEKTFRVFVSLEQIIECDEMEGFNDLINELAEEEGHIGKMDILSDIEYTVVGYESHNLVEIEVSAVVVNADTGE